nr:MAG TPA: hypothetical protein [Caudoviricetes sp.]
MNEVLAAEKPEDEELVDVLTAISVISMRLARKIVMLASQSQIKEGGTVNGQNQRTGHGNQRSPQSCCHY